MSRLDGQNFDRKRTEDLIKSLSKKKKLLLVRTIRKEFNISTSVINSSSVTLTDQYTFLYLDQVRKSLSGLY